MVSIGLIGTGIFANQKHLPAIAKTEGLEIKGVYNRTTSKAQDFAATAEEAQRGTKVKVYEKVEDLINDPEIDAIDALLPVEHNLSIVQQAINAKKPISFEKPLAATLDDAAEIVKLSESTDVPVMVLENWSFHHGTTKLKELLPRIGDIVLFNYQASGPFRLSAYHGTSWRQQPKHVGGFLSDGGVHDLALITDVLGQIGSVSAKTAQWRHESGAVDTLSALLNLADGKAFGTYTQARYVGAAEPVLRFQIFGKNGSLVYEKPAGAFAGKVHLYEGKDSSEIKSTTFDLPEDELNGVTEEFIHWKNVLAGEEKVFVPPRKAYHHYAAIHAAIESADNDGQIVNVKQL